MSVIGITGGISTGKTAFADYLRALIPKARFFDADSMARELTRSDEKVLGEIRARFGPAVFQKNGELNRGALRAIVFDAPEKRRDLEQILHPPIRQRWSGEAERYRNSTELFFADIPLLYETDGDTLCDRVIVVACSEDIQMERLMRRTGMTEAESQTVIRAQMPLPEKIKRADHVVWNNGPQSVLADQARLLVNLWTRR
ncbi:MAG: dephospho-CoA kinase [Verrucomicrobia bacterium]|nr:MAG: dephospho-CoA kinase [Verrucomicrobiota bacterium]